MPLPVQGGFQRGPSCWDRVKMGFTIGFCVGMASGALFGGFSALRYGLREEETTNNQRKNVRDKSRIDLRRADGNGLGNPFECTIGTANTVTEDQTTAATPSS
uniref:Reactive oxygen species modulator 1 n=1 Tax=Ixodes ricinus TaxID=34613 RepID=V5IHR3_IXORI